MAIDDLSQFFTSNLSMFTCFLHLNKYCNRKEMKTENNVFQFLCCSFKRNLFTNNNNVLDDDDDDDDEL